MTDEYNPEAADYVAGVVEEISKERGIGIERIQFILLKLSENDIDGIGQKELESLIADEELKVKFTGLIKALHDKGVVSDLGERVYLNNPAWHYLAKLGKTELVQTNPGCLAETMGCKSLCPGEYFNLVDLSGGGNDN